MGVSASARANLGCPSSVNRVDAGGLIKVLRGKGIKNIGYVEANLMSEVLEAPKVPSDTVSEKSTREQVK